MTCVVFGAASGVGALLTQVAKLRGARVLGVVSSDKKVDAARAAGSNEVIIYTRGRLEDEVRRFTEGQGAQVVFDSIGQLTFSSSVNCLATRGTLVLFGNSSGPVPTVDPQLLMQKGSLFFTRPTLGHFIGGGQLQSRAEALFDWLAEGRLVLPSPRQFPLRDAAQSHREFESPEHTGKVVLES